MERFKGSFIYKGIIYPSVKKCCESIDVNYNTVVSRKFNNNISYEEAVDRVINNPLDTTFTFNGQKFKSIKECCAKYNVSYETVMRLKNKNKEQNYEDIINNLINSDLPNNRFEITVNGIKYRSIKECCRKLKLKYSTLRGRKIFNNFTWEQAVNDLLTHPEDRRKNKKITNFNQ